LPSLAAAVAGAADVVATDWAAEALSLVDRNAERNGLRIVTALVDWQAPPPSLSGFDVVLAADLLYEERNAVPLLGMLAAATTAEGTVLIADPGRRHAAGFFERADADGWSIVDVTTDRLPAGGISILRKGMSHEAGRRRS
jgi:predicted nicotinamide N-methyase